MMSTDLRYPIGRFQIPNQVTQDDLRTAIAAIASLPSELRAAVEGLDNVQLDTPYRPDGWTVRQVVHHLADSHMNSYVRMRLALTEDAPTISAYDENAWANLTDAKASPVDVSLNLLEALHTRWVTLLQSLPDTAWQRTFRHPQKGPVPLGINARLYAWHGKHHLAHITGLRSRNRW